MLGRGLESLIPPKKENNFGQDAPSNNPAGRPENEKISFSETERKTTEINPARQEQILPVGREEAKSPDGQNELRKEKISQDRESIFHIEVEKIIPNPHQPRRDFNQEELKDLAASIREHGIIQPLIVSKLEKDTDTGTSVEYQLIAGERRLQAAKLAGMERVPAIIRKLSQKAEGLELAIIENLQRSNLNPVETARAYAKLQDEFGLTQREIGTRLGKSRETIANALRLLNLPTEIQDAVGQNKINESQARLLLAISDINEQKKLFNEILNQNLSVREIRYRINKENPSVPAAGSGNGQSTKTDPEMISMEEKLKELLGAPVKIEKKDNSGKIIITFYSPEEIEGIIQKLNPQTNL
jgi:ParB family chromosome partitioning protein